MTGLAAKLIWAGLSTVEGNWPVHAAPTPLTPQNMIPDDELDRFLAIKDPIVDAILDLVEALHSAQSANIPPSSVSIMLVCPFGLSPPYYHVGVAPKMATHVS